MRVIVISDTHNRQGAFIEMLSKLGDYDKLIHLGDGINDALECRALINADLCLIRGNGDFTDHPTETVLTVGDNKIFCTHGHHYNVKLSKNALADRAKQLGCNAALFGHTHIMYDESIDGVRLINPGSIGYPYSEVGFIEITESSIRLIVQSA